MRNEKMSLSQNTSHAVMSQRHESNLSLDDFPTPPWATRALLEHVLKKEGLSDKSCLEPACGRGYMAKALMESFGTVNSLDVHDYGFGDVGDFLKDEIDKTDWTITNPPFKLAEEFINKSLEISREGVAILTRTVFLESIGRYNRLFTVRPPTILAQFAERVPMVKGRVDPKATTTTGYAWMIWKKECFADTRLVWIPPCRKELEKKGDYNQTEQRTPIERYIENCSTKQYSLD
jgi:hypothetical protein